MIVSTTAKFRGHVTLVVAFSAVVCAGHAEARMYQWSNVVTGTVQLSGSPPAWYRSTTPGPRVFVFDNGRLIDDTAVTVSHEQRLVLRADALGTPEPPEPVALSVIRQNTLLDALENAALDGVDVTAVTEAFTAQQGREVENRGGLIAQTVAELKALIEAWDSRRLDEAKALLHNAVGDIE